MTLKDLQAMKTAENIKLDAMIKIREILDAAEKAGCIVHLPYDVVVAKEFRANPPVRIVGQASYADRSAASKAEWQLKQLPREAKPGFFSSGDRYPDPKTEGL